MRAHLHRRFPRNLCMHLVSFDTGGVRETYRHDARQRRGAGGSLSRWRRAARDLQGRYGRPRGGCGARTTRLRCGAAGPPAEAARWDHGTPAQSSSTRQITTARFCTTCCSRRFPGAAGPGHIWHWDASVDRNDSRRHDGRFAEVVKGWTTPRNGSRLPCRSTIDCASMNWHYGGQRRSGAATLETIGARSWN